MMYWYFIAYHRLDAHGTEIGKGTAEASRARPITSYRQDIQTIQDALQPGADCVSVQIYNYILLRVEDSL